MVQMKHIEVVTAFSALGHEHRLAIYRLLVEAGLEGLSAGVIADKLRIPPSSLTFHTQALVRAGLVKQRRESRLLIYTADFGAMNALIGYLTENCCGGAQNCAPACKPEDEDHPVSKNRSRA
jgi:DNA-binding transcriptional ArsR family regulator